jgi:hypothetical protein
MDEETEFLLKRAAEEARRAISSPNEEAANAHQGMAIRYSAGAVAKLADEADRLDETNTPQAQEDR